MDKGEEILQQVLQVCKDMSISEYINLHKNVLNRKRKELTIVDTIKQKYVNYAMNNCGEYPNKLILSSDVYYRMKNVLYDNDKRAIDILLNEGTFMNMDVCIYVSGKDNLDMYHG